MQAPSFAGEVLRLTLPLRGKEFEAYVTREFRHFARMAAECGKRLAVIASSGNDRPYEIPASMAEPSRVEREFGSVLNQSIHSANLPITPAVLRALDLIAQNPESKYFLSRVSPDLSKQIQIAATESTQSLIVGATPQQVIGRNRSDFWLDSDLDAFNQELRQRFSVGAVVDYSFRGCSPVTKNHWRRFRSQATCLEILADGSIIQLGQTFQAIPIEVPVLR
jgi:hypothetical protein